ncbi:hypothetical protein N7456_006853 [Penicillium angulare]|uniref:Uncharacterized protein n=1 Tax=Penicillium angulare TaxID=116970 RepID=A0A9W9KCL1_9EURO|nr:hypothetical protein N7456_006853 [Penicillium angulare]
MLQYLPAEILIIIAEWNERFWLARAFADDIQLPPSALRCLIQANSTIYRALTPEVYRAVTFRAASEWALNVLDIDSFFRHHSKDTQHLIHTRHLKIEAPIHLTRFNRCAAFNIFRAVGLDANLSTIGTTNNEKAHGQFLEDISDQLHLAFAHLRPNSLRPFTWRLGTCLPPGILDREGYLIRHHKHLAHLSLVTDGSCPYAASHLNALPELSALKTLEWEGIQSAIEATLLRQCIRRNQARLETLSVKFSASAARLDFYQEVLGVQGPVCLTSTDAVDPPPGFLSCLTSLKLARALLPRTPVAAWSIVPRLKSLALRDCVNSCDFLEALSRTPHQLQLRLFKFSSDDLVSGPGKTNDLSAVTAFLLSFRGLKHLYLKVSNFARSHQIESALRHHDPTLKTLVYHEKQLTPIDNERLWWGTRDYCPAWILDTGEAKRLNRRSALALCANFSSVVSRLHENKVRKVQRSLTWFIKRVSLEPGARNSLLQVLHFRLTGTDHLHRDIQSEVISHIQREDKNCPCGCWRGLTRETSLPVGDFDMVNLWEEPFQAFRARSSDDSDASGTLCSELDEIEEFLEFADWAFGPSGLPKLEVFAFGDFSYEERHRKQRFLARRKHHITTDLPTRVSRTAGYFALGI